MNIINLSSHSLNTEEKELLSLGLSFCPSASLDKFSIVKDIFLFARQIFYKIIYQNKTKKDLPTENMEEELNFSVHGDLDCSIPQEITELLEQQESLETILLEEASDWDIKNPTRNIQEEINIKCKKQI